MDRQNLSDTEGELTRADRSWRSEMTRAFGPDAVLLHGFSSAGQGAPGSKVRRAYEARQKAIAAWRQARHFAGDRLQEKAA